MDKFSGAWSRLSGLPQQKISTISFLVLLVLLCYQLAVLTWRLVPVPSSNASTWRPESVAAQNSGAAYDTAKINRSNLFGKYQTEKKVVVKQTTDAPKTKLRLTLTGLIAASDPNLAMAIIENNGRQDSYFIESPVDRTGAVLKEIQTDRVIIEYRGRLETLMLDGENYSKSAAPQQRKSEAPRAETRKITIDRKELLANPGKLTDYLRISPVRKHGELVGYRINPGKDTSLFKQAGLKANDLATSLNGIDLTDMQQAMTLMKDLPTMTDISLTVERNGQLYELYFSLPE